MRHAKQLMTLGSVLLLGASLALAGQLGRLRVAVTDENGDAMKGVKVTATHAGTNRAYDLSTSAKGKGMFPALEGGSYVVRFEIDDHQILEKNATIQVGVTGELSAEMTPRIRVITDDELTEEQLKAKRSGNAYNDAVARFRAGDVAGARQLALQALEFDPQLGAAYILLARVDSQEKNHAAAADNYEKAIELDPNLENYLPNLVAELQLAGRHDEADVYAEQLDLQPQERPLTPKELYDRAVLKINGGDDPGALELLEKLLVAEPQHPAGIFQRGLIRIRQGDNPSAVEDLKRYLALAPAGEFAGQAQGLLNALGG